MANATKFDKLKADSLEVSSTVGQVVTYTLKSLGTLTTGTFKDGIRVPRAFVITDIRTKVATVPTGATLIVDVNKNATTIFSTQGNRPTTAISAADSSTTAPDVTTGAAGDILSVDVDQIGSSVAGANLFVAITVRFTS